MIIIGRAIEGIPLNGLEYLMNADDTDYMFFKNKCEAMDFLNSIMQEPLSDEQLEDAFMFLDTETDFENPEAFNNE
jgi:hypothetical protein